MSNILLQTIGGIFLLCAYNLMVTWSQGTSGISNIEVPGVFDLGLKKHHVVRRSVEGSQSPFNHSYECTTTNLPNPSPEYPAILFQKVNYNNCTGSGFYIRMRPGHFHKWCSNNNEKRFRNIVFASMLMLPGINVTFRGCCPSGNEFYKTVTEWQNTPDLNHSVYFSTNLSLTSGIWYAGWLYWDTAFYVRIDKDQQFSVSGTCGTCYFGQCGAAGKCECAPGYSGSECQTRPTNDSYPTHQYPLILFKNINFEGSYLKVNPESFVVFATNRQNSRNYEYNSMRVLYNRSVIFSRNNVFPVTLQIGGDIQDIPNFMLGNTDISNTIWMSYDAGMDADFSVKVVGNRNCDNCSVTTGCCYTGTCRCFAGYTGVNCDIPLLS